MCRATEFHLPNSEQARTELTELCAHALLDGVSLVARDVRTNQIVGHAINKIQVMQMRRLGPKHRDGAKRRTLARVSPVDEQKTVANPITMHTQ